MRASGKIEPPSVLKPLTTKSCCVGSGVCAKACAVTPDAASSIIKHAKTIDVGFFISARNMWRDPGIRGALTGNGDADGCDEISTIHSVPLFICLKLPRH